MVWCMQSCHFDVDVDLLFQENSSIGQKIALTEKIVKVLPKMECPHRIEPHQIQGLDFIHIFPVIQWLVKKSVKVREEQRDFIRTHAIRKFDKQFPSEDGQVSPVVIQNVKQIQEVFRPRRVLKRIDATPEEESQMIQSTLMEYGLPGKSSDKDVFVNDLQNVYTETHEHEQGISANVIGNIVSSQVQKIAQVSKQFAKLEVDLEESGKNYSTLILSKQTDALTEEKENLEQEKQMLENEIVALSEELNKVKKNIQQVDEEIPISGTDNNYTMYKKLQSLVSLEQNLKVQEKLFREQCRIEMEKLQQMVRDAEERNIPAESNTADKQYEEERELIKLLRLQIAKKNRSIAFLQRQLDEIPGRGELAQYQRRFLELYSQVAQKHEETKQFYTMYNTLDDTKLYLSKELSLLNSVLDNYTEVMSNSGDKEEFIRQFESIVSTIKQNKMKVEKRKAEEKARRDKLSQHLLELVEQQRNYVSVVRQLKIECKRNEELLAHYRGHS